MRAGRTDHRTTIVQSLRQRSYGAGLLRASRQLLVRHIVEAGDVDRYEVAADLLGVSRPTLMKLAREGEIDSFKVGTHTRFKRDEVLRVRDARAAKRRAAFDELRALDEEHEELFDD